MISIRDRIFGGIWGLLIGDALGVPYEFSSPLDIPPLERIEFAPPPSFMRAHQGTPSGTWSDDGAQALCLLDSLLVDEDLNIRDFANRLLAWYEHGLWAVDNVVFDVGNQTAKALWALKNGKSPLMTGFEVPDGKGNGALMRVLPVALLHSGSDEKLVEKAHLQSVVTHGHVCNQVCCALYCLWAKELLKGCSSEQGYLISVKKLKEIYKDNEEYLYELEYCLRADEKIEGSGGGYVIDSFRSVRMILEDSQSYEMVVKNAVALGDDTDTTAAIAGGLAGIIYGLEGIPNRWMAELRGKELVETLIKRMEGIFLK